ncbi:MAG: hypothetical protein OEY52_02305 [Gammaproteobacteria bacterium]|nr:hypothetical protein [Gammaproteobacteria bacterium]
MQKGIIVLLGLLFGACSINPESAEQQSPLKISSQLSPQAPQAEDVLFVNLLSVDGQWLIQSIGSQRKPVDLLKEEERLYIQTDKKIVMPDYVHYQFTDETRRQYDCGKDVKYNKHTTYNPCTSQFSRNIKYGEGWFGWRRQLDVGAIREAISQSDLINRANQEIALVRKERQRCLNLRKQAEQHAARQQVQLRVLDETGMYKQGHELVQYDLKVQPRVAYEGCEQNLDDVQLSYDLGLKQDFGLVLELRGKSGWNQLEGDTLHLERKIAEADKKLIPTLHIKGKQVKRYNLYQEWSNNDLDFTWRTLDISDTDLRQVFNIRNKNKQAITIESVSFIINKHVVTRKTPHVIKPESSLNGLEHASRYFVLGKNVRQHIEAIKVIETDSERARFGIRVVYKQGNEQKELQFAKDLSLASFL